jgi:hypothetical protein
MVFTPGGQSAPLGANLKSGTNPANVSYHASGVIIYNATSSLVRFESKNSFFCSGKRSNPLQRSFLQFFRAPNALLTLSRCEFISASSVSTDWTRFDESVPAVIYGQHLHISGSNPTKHDYPNFTHTCKIFYTTKCKSVKRQVEKTVHMHVHNALHLHVHM